VSVSEASRVDCVCLTGPTACGKTELALALAQRVPLEVISMDSALVYRGLDIGTAKPSREIRAAVPHHLIDILEPTEAYSAGRFARDAAALVEEIRARDRLPLLVGGTLLYLRALRDGLAPLPRGDRALRTALDREAAELGLGALHDRLRCIDPAAAARIAPTDRQRIQRALEVHALTSRPITELQRATGDRVRTAVLAVALYPDSRTELAARIERRFDAMLAAGFLHEVEQLRARGDLTPDMPSMRSVGYRQLWAYLDGQCSLEAARAKAIVATRQYAKRQLTWLRGDPRIETWPAGAPDLVERLVERLSKESLTAKKGRRLC
jgi:tRNA dimethylallyltransferase